jgi:hypothetical protein
VVDVAVFAFVGLALFELRRIRPPAVPNIQAAFQDLDHSIERFVPDIPKGYTWEEAVERLKGAGVDVDWKKMEGSLSDYEAFRYGQKPMPGAGKDEVVRLSMKIRRRVVGYRNKRKSTGAD